MRRLAIIIAITLSATTGAATAQNYCPDTTLVTASPTTGEELYVAPLSFDDWDHNARNLSAICRGETNPRGDTLPSTCAVGDVFFDTDAAAGANIFGCTSTDFWTLQSGGGGGSSTEIVNLQKSSAQSIANDTPTDLTWETEIEDTEGYHAANSAEVIIPAGKAGVFSIECGVAFATGTGTRFLDVWVGTIFDGISIARQKVHDLGTSQFSQVSVSRSRRLPDGERVTCLAYQDSGGAIDATSSGLTFMTMVRLGD
jgi:hypothetical protein